MKFSCVSSLVFALFLAAWQQPAWAANDAAENALTLEETVSLKTVTAAKISPNGLAVAYRLSVPRKLYQDADGKAWSELHVANLEGESRPYFSGKS